MKKKLGLLIVRSNYREIDWILPLIYRIKLKYKLITFFVLPPNIQVLKNRLLNRHKGQEKLIEQRMKKFNEEVSHWDEYDYVVVNDNLEICYDAILHIIKSEQKGIRHKQNIEEIKVKIKELIN